MSLSDWNNKTGGNVFSLVTSPKYAGAKSLKMDCSAASASIKILTQSETDSPKDCSFKTQLYLGKPTASNQRYSINIFSRYVDINNYYNFYLQCQDDPRISVYFGKKHEGSTALHFIAHINGADKFDDWFEWEFRFCEVSNKVYGLVYRAGAYIGENEEIVHFTSGGGIGFGHRDKQTWSKDAFFDETKIYY